MCFLNCPNWHSASSVTSLPFVCLLGFMVKIGQIWDYQETY